MNFIKSFFTFHYTTICGLIIGCWLYLMHSENQPISTFLTETHLYLILLLVTLGFRLITWLLLDKANLSGLGKFFLYGIRDFIVLNAVTLSTIGALFLLNVMLRYT
ncbi:MAG: hypothetical protein LBU87_03595 [Lactobacillales bacterium]|jgi:hypothetical protein|nr:hypothetical protein [Lactobacillales bacterium]